MSKKLNDEIDAIKKENAKIVSKCDFENLCKKLENLFMDFERNR